MAARKYPLAEKDSEINIQILQICQAMTLARRPASIVCNA
jgi:hypothetical protein